MSSQSDQLKQRTLTFGVDVLRLVDDLPRTLAGQTIGRQLARSGPAIGSNYRRSLGQFRPIGRNGPIERPCEQERQVGPK
ncbi:MAG: hypothetical protein DMF90_09015 [Acidobacteria bacterium]|nr:MAG: hypothetical protein DMF90_09015 [Acidobacteriota bacterium]